MNFIHQSPAWYILLRSWPMDQSRCFEKWKSTRFTLRSNVRKASRYHELSGVHKVHLGLAKHLSFLRILTTGHSTILHSKAAKWLGNSAADHLVYNAGMEWQFEKGKIFLPSNLKKRICPSFSNPAITIKRSWLSYVSIDELITFTFGAPDERNSAEHHLLQVLTPSV